MKQLMKDCKNIVMKKMGILCIFLFCIIAGMGMLWGNDVISLCQGTKDFREVEEDILNNKEEASVKHDYIHTDVEMIIGSYAEYQKQDGSHHEVYYLMPIQNGSYFITIIANENYIPILDEMEMAFYNSIGKENKEYPEELRIEGGFRLLNNEEKSYALDFYTGYDETITTIDDISNILSPYAIEIGNIGTISIEHLWTMFTLWIVMLLILFLFAILYASNFFLRTLQKDINHLPESCKLALDKDYVEAKQLLNSKFGKKMLYQREFYTIRVFSYEQLIWLYKKEKLDKNKRNIAVYAYDYVGKQYILFQSSVEKEADKYIQEMFDHCSDAILGNQDYLYEIWRKSPRQLPVKIKELQDMKKKNEVKKEKKKTDEDEGKKEQSKIKKRKVVKDKKDTKKKDNKSQDEKDETKNKDIS